MCISGVGYINRIYYDLNDLLTFPQSYPFPYSATVEDWKWIETTINPFAGTAVFVPSQDIFDGDVQLEAQVSSITFNHEMIASIVYGMFDNNTQDINTFLRHNIMERLNCKMNTEDYFKKMNFAPISSWENIVESGFFDQNEETMLLSTLSLIVPNCPRLGTLYFTNMEKKFYQFDQSTGRFSFVDTFNVWNVPNTPEEYINPLNVKIQFH